MLAGWPCCLRKFLRFPTRYPTAKEQLLERLPKEWRAEVTRKKIFDEYEFRYTYANDSAANFSTFYTEPELKYDVLKNLVDLPGGQAFVLEHLSELPADTRQAIYLRIGTDAKELWIHEPGLSSVLEHAAATDPDSQASTAASQALRMLEAHRLKNALEIRLEDSRFISYPQDRVANSAERDQFLKQLRPLYLTMDGITLPSFAIDPTRSSRRRSTNPRFVSRSWATTGRWTKTTATRSAWPTP